jgi:zinc D-Ala-D-Ala dipeptidase
MSVMARYVFLVYFLLLGPAMAEDSSKKTTEVEFSGFVDAATIAPRLTVELKYATTDNFLGRNVYGSLRRCYLQRRAAQQLAEASRLLHEVRPDLHLLAYDCARPRRVQRLMWQLVRGTPRQVYVADPTVGSLHSSGCAIDLTLADKKPLEMGASFDEFSAAARPSEELTLYQSGKLTSTQLAHRLLLRWVMVRAGWLPSPIEWWHFTCARPRARQ